MSEHKPSLSIITPVYNREKLIERCYESLLCQTDKDFEWIIVDDGSTDNTLEKVRQFEADFVIKIIEKPNGGKHTALNASHGHIDGKYVLILDSDDVLIPEAVAEVKNAWNCYESNSEIAIVTLLKGRDVDSPSCRAFKDDEGKPVDIMRYKREKLYSSDACEVIRTEQFMQFPFPVFNGEKFVSEGALWNRVSFTHKCVYVNKVIYLADYLEGGLTKSGKPLRVHNPNGGMYTANLNMNRKNFLNLRIKNGLLYTCYGFFAKKTLRQMSSQCDAKLLMWICLPFGFLLYRYWKRKYY